MECFLDCTWKYREGSWEYTFNESLGTSNFKSQNPKLLENHLIRVVDYSRYLISVSPSAQHQVTDWLWAVRCRSPHIIPFLGILRLTPASYFMRFDCGEETHGYFAHMFMVQGRQCSLGNAISMDAHEESLWAVQRIKIASKIAWIEINLTHVAFSSWFKRELYIGYPTSQRLSSLFWALLLTLSG